MARKRSENVGWGQVCRRLNQERRESDTKNKPLEDGEIRFFRGNAQKPRHPNSAIFERDGRVPPRRGEITTNDNE
jgi:hypothetical protein